MTQGRVYVSRLVALAVCAAWSSTGSAQTPPTTDPDREHSSDATARPTNRASEPASVDPSERPRPEAETIGGLPEPARGERYTSPVKTLGIGIGGNSYLLSAGIGLIYLSAVYPLQAVFGSNTVEPVMLWLLLPIIGPWMAQYEDLVKDKPGWRAVLIVDAGLQATGLVLGLVGAALSGTRSRTREPTTTGFELQLGEGGVGLLSVSVSLRTP